MTECPYTKDRLGDKLKDDFDALVRLHDEVKSFKIKYSADTLAVFSSGKNAKFNRSCIESESLNLSSTATCTYAVAEYSELWKKNKIENSRLRDLKEYWDYIVDGLTTRLKESEQLDEFSLLNILASLKKIQERVGDRSRNQDIVNIIGSLCKEFNKNLFAFVENPHPIIHYKFLIVLEDWGKELIEQKKLKEKKISDFLNKIYDAGKYEMYRQIALFYANDETLFDIKRLVYSLLIVKRNGRYSNNLIIDKALEIFFKQQLHTGLLPIGHVVNNDFVLRNGRIVKKGVTARPILSSFECFSDLLSSKDLRNDLKKCYEKFEKAYEWTRERLRKNKGETLGWYPEYESTHVAESWVTSPILLFLKNYCTLLSELISDSAGEYLHAEKVDPQKLCDTYEIKTLINSMTEEYRSALVFGPIGAGKSTIAKYLVNILPKKEEWQYIELIYAQFLINGQENIIPTANEIFKRLDRIKKTVVLFDQIDQLVKRREKGGEPWVIAALLPKFEELGRQKEIRFILTTNNVEEIAPDILRPGIIDLVLPMGAFSWKGRLKLLEEIIEDVPDVPDDTTKRELKAILFNNIPVQDITKTAIHNEPTLNKLSVFLEKTNFMSLLDMKKILKNVFIKGKLEEIQNDSQYQTFFLKNGLEDYFIDEDYSTFHQQLREPESTLRPKIRLPMSKRGQELQIIEENTFC